MFNIALIICTITLVYVIIELALAGFEAEFARTTSLVIKLFVLVISFVIGISHMDEKEPTALDVYRNQTTLKVTYCDSVAIDTVVVFKKFD
jgi:hypothetical protein